MTNLARVRANWTGFAGAPGVSTFYGLDGPAMLGPLTAFFGALAGAIPIDVSIHVENAGDQINDVTGDLVDSWTGAIQGIVGGTSNSVYAAPTGILFNWFTGQILDSHRLRGKTYIVPASPATFDMDGSVLDSTITAFEAVGATLIDDLVGNLCVWHRPRAAAAATAYHPAVTKRDGGHGLVTACSVPDKAVVLRSRRD